MCARDPAIATRAPTRRNHDRDRSTTAHRGSRAAKRDRTHYLYIAVIVAVVLGILVGLARPGLRQSS